MQTISIWIIAGFISYITTVWIKNLIWNIIASTIVWIIVVHYLKKFLNGDF